MSSKGTDKAAGKGKGRAKGAINYQPDLLIDIVEELLPNGALGWQKVCQVYYDCSCEVNLRDFNQVRKNWANSPSFCNSNKKPTGRKGEKGD